MGYQTLESKSESLAKISSPETIKQLKSYIGLVHHVTKFIPGLAALFSAFRDLFKIGKKKRFV